MIINKVTPNLTQAQLLEGSSSSKTSKEENKSLWGELAKRKQEIEEKFADITAKHLENASAFRSYFGNIANESSQDENIFANFNQNIQNTEISEEDIAQLEERLQDIMSAWEEQQKKMDELVNKNKTLHPFFKQPDENNRDIAESSIKFAGQ